MYHNKTKRPVGSEWSGRAFVADVYQGRDGRFSIREAGR